MNWKIILFDCLIIAIGFAIIETIFRWYNDNGYTTLEQFIMNFFYAPVSIHGYRSAIKVPILRIIFFPLNVWVAELVMGSYLLYVHDRRVWIYQDEYALFNGFITLSFVLYWILLGSLVVLVFDHLLMRP